MDLHTYTSGHAAGRIVGAKEGYQKAKLEIVDLLCEVSDFLDNYVDVLDGDYGEPRPNKAMSLKARVDELI
jgi:hypothetical protein